MKSAERNGELSVRREEGKIWSHIRKKWLDETPEERVRQEYLLVLVNEYGFSLDQIGEEWNITGRGSGKAFADFVIWRTTDDKEKKKSPLIIVECKSDNITISKEVYFQADHYARMAGAPFFVTHNKRETKYWRVKTGKMPKQIEEIEDIPHADASDKEIDELIEKLKEFKEKEFADLLHKCHNVIRNREKKDPAAAFDEIAKILFVKVYVERELKEKKRRKNVFSVDYLEDQIGDNPLDDLFQKTKRHYRDDRIFDEDENINLKVATGKEIVSLLERYNLSATSEDIKGIAFERFLGTTFRGDIGQFFTPRTIVTFMVQMVEPKEGDIICDPASGSGGFLISFFEIVRQQIAESVDKDYNKAKRKIEKRKNLTSKEKATLLIEEDKKRQDALDQTRESSRMWKLANRYIFGVDANDRMARTSKMNMIMHGDGHGGVHHGDGFININGIFDRRFDIVLTNPPFGAKVEASDKIILPEVPNQAELDRRYTRLYGDEYKEAVERVRAKEDKPIGSLYRLPKKGRTEDDVKQIPTEILFLERCLGLLKPGGRLGIVLPEGVFNNPSRDYIRHFAEKRAYLKAVVSLPQETFYSRGASVKASLLFMQKFTENEEAKFEGLTLQVINEIEELYRHDIDNETYKFESELEAAEENNDKERFKELKKQLKDYLRDVENETEEKTWGRVKELFNYPIFMYEAEKVGLTATGETDENELYPNEKKPADCGMTCLELYKEFLKKPEQFVIEKD